MNVSKVRKLLRTHKYIQTYIHKYIDRLDYASQLWSPHKISQITQIEKVQRSFTKHIAELSDLSYHDRLQTLKLYSLQKAKEKIL